MKNNVPGRRNHMNEFSVERTVVFGRAFIPVPLGWNKGVIEWGEKTARGQTTAGFCKV